MFLDRQGLGWFSRWEVFGCDGNWNFPVWVTLWSEFRRDFPCGDERFERGSPEEESSVRKGYLELRLENKPVLTRVIPAFRERFRTLEKEERNAKARERRKRKKEEAEREEREAECPLTWDECLKLWD